MFNRLHPLSDFLDRHSIIDSFVSYWYEGHCWQSGELLTLPRTSLAEAIARGLMQDLGKDERYSREGKMYGILIVELPGGERRILKAFSGLLDGCSEVDGWVPQIPGRDRVSFDEVRTLKELEAIKQELIALKQLPERHQYETLRCEFERELQQMSDRHRQRKQQRQEKRQIVLVEEISTEELERLDEESRRDGIERKQLKRKRDEALKELKEAIAIADLRIRQLKQRRKELSRQLQAQMHAVYSLTNFLGMSQTLQELMPEGLPTGTGDCCAPKLLHYAATRNLKPLAMAEFWWGDSSGDKIKGEFYEACRDRCQPLMGFLLSGLSVPLLKVESTSLGRAAPTKFKINILPCPPCPPCLPKDAPPLPIFYEDEWLIAVNKPPGLLSVPGRDRNTQDSVLSRLRLLLSDGMKLIAVHRLDRDTSGILLLARDLETYRHLSRQFERREVKKVYEAILAGIVTRDRAAIELPLWGDPENRPYQQVNWEYGKPSITLFQVIERKENTTCIEFTPLTGRTHQLRVHSADARGLGTPILGDKLYGCGANTSRLHLHARELCFVHPQLGKMLKLYAQTTFS
jgi:tRNA pseudouridine32 synthase / 23S rRNA pseudouridine746 synthase